MMRPDTQCQPPRRKNHAGAPRRIGVEIEFAAVSARSGAEKVRDLFGGSIREEDPHRFHIEETQYGVFRCELDTQYAHRPDGGDVEIGLFAENGKLRSLMEKFDASMRALVGDVSAVIVPCEIVCPPIAVDELKRLEELVDSLTSAGAAGTRSNPLYAFGAQLNPDIASSDPAWLVAVFKAYLLLSDWLRAVMSIDPTRRLFAFADRFPSPYITTVLDPCYWPDTERFIDDYLAANPTRNRELDMLPLMAWLDEPRVRATVDDPRIKPRPTFHYRLPDANLEAPDWGLVLEWNRWCIVERLAEDRAKLNAMGSAYRANRERWISDNWAIKSTEWLLAQ